MPFQANWMQEKLAKMLAKLREDRGLTTRQIAEELGWAPSKVSRMENARNQVDPLDVIKLGQFYKLPENEIAQLCEMARDTRTDAWEERYEPWVPEPYLRLARYERQAKIVRSSQAGVVPGLCQTRAYAAAVIQSSPVAYDDETAEALIEFRMQRQGRLEEPDFLQLAVVIAEPVLYWQYGGPQVLHEQLEHLRELADRPNVDLYVVPFSTAVVMLPLEIFQFDDSEVAAVAFSETMWTNVLHEGPQDTRRANRMFQRHVSRALPSDQAKSLIEERIRGTQ